MIHRLIGLVILLACAGAALSYASTVSRLARRMPAIVLVPLGAIVVFTPKTGMPPLATVAGTALQPIDLVIAISLLATLLNFQQLKVTMGRARLSVVALCGLVVGQTAIGYASFGAPAALDARNTIALLALVLYFLSLDADVARAAVRPWLYWVAAGLVLVALSNIARDGLGNANDLLERADGLGQVTSRPLVSEQAVFLAAAAVSAFLDWTSGRSTRYGWAAIALLATAVACQHRSVWVAVAVGFAIVIPRISRGRIGVALLLAGWAAAVAVLVVSISPLRAELGGALQDSAATASLTSGTGADRFGSAQVLIHQQIAKGQVPTLIGSPFGSGYDRVVGGRFEGYQPHNAYVQIFLRIGVVGLLAMATLLVTACRRARQGTAHQREQGWVAIFCTYALAYAFPNPLAPLLACALHGPSPSLDAPARDKESGRVVDLAAPHDPALPDSVSVVVLEGDRVGMAGASSHRP